MAKGLSDEDWWYLSIHDYKDFDWFIENTGVNDRYIATIDDTILERIKQRFTCKWVLSCQRLYLPESIKLSKTSMAVANVLQSDAEHIYSNSNYKTYTSVGYIRDQIVQGPSSACRIDGVLAGWVLTHDDGAMGMLHVLEDYRRQGIANDLVIDLIQKIRALGQTPFTYVESTNIASMSLVKRLGFKVDKPIHWVNIDR
jgi:8-oxo-dGTP diphosphatase